MFVLTPLALIVLPLPNIAPVPAAKELRAAFAESILGLLVL